MNCVCQLLQFARRNIGGEIEVERQGDWHAQQFEFVKMNLFLFEIGDLLLIHFHTCHTQHF